MQDRYAAAEQLLAAVTAEKVRNAAPVVRWVGDRNLCWYRRETAEGCEWVVVDAASGDRRPAFDHAALAQSLRALDHEAEAAKLAIDVKRIDIDAIEFVLEKKRFRYARVGGELTALGDVEPATGPSRSPDGRWSLSQRDGNLWLAAAGGDAQPITTDGSPDDGYAIHHGGYKAGHVPRSRVAAGDRPAGVEWAPDSSKVIVWRIDQRHVASYPYVETAPHDGTFRPKLHQPRMPLTGEAPPTIRWLCLDLATRRLVPLRLPEDQLHLHQDWEAVRKWIWSADCRRVRAVMFGAQQKAAYLLDVDLASGDAAIVVSERDEPRVELNTTLYSQPAVAIIGDLEEVIWYSHRSGWGHLYRYDAKTGRLLNAVTQGDWLVRDLIDVDPKTGRILFTAQGREGGNPYLRALYSVNPDGSGLQRLTPAGVDADINPGLSAISKTTEFHGHLSPDRRFVAYTRSTVSQPPQACLLDLETGGERVLEEADVSALLASGYVPPEAFVTLAADGTTEIHGLLYRPREIEPGAKVPLMVAQYASPLMAACPKGYMGAVTGPGMWISPAAFTALGCAVIALDARGTTGRSRAFATAGQGRLNLIGVDDYVAAIRQLGERHAWLDTSRVGIQGGSYGGYAVIRAMIEFPEVFTAGLSAAPLCSVHNMYPDVHWTGWHGEPDYGDGSAERPDPKARPQNYASTDATQQVERIKNPLLIVAGELDENCPLGPIMQFYAAAVEADAPVELTVLPNRNHYTLARTRYTYRRAMDFFCRHLLGEEPPRDFRFTVLPQLPEPDDRATAW
ncbi:MAG TPA: prolyl oligopeptidase family serine peptidase [Nevskiaceae bacterium]|nr:prolyl oligopeptidase family serine peptidase [Nevskiaceae bacterium]